MTFNEQVNDALQSVREGRLATKNEEQLHSMIVVLRKFRDSQYSPTALDSIEAMENELSRRQTERLNSQTEKLTGSVRELVLISDAQKRLAEKLDSQTAKLVNLTRGLLWLTGGLLVFTVALLAYTVFLYKDAHEEMRRNQLADHGQTDQTTNYAKPTIVK